MASGSRELLASREHVWSFLAEPNHLADWWPGIVGVEPDRRGFAEGARWRVFRHERDRIPLPTSGQLGKVLPDMLVITRLWPLEQWAWQLVGNAPKWRALSSQSVEVRLRATAPDRTLVTITIAPPPWYQRWSSAGDRRTAEIAVRRLYDLVQTAAAL